MGVWSAVDIFSVRAADGRGWKSLHRLRLGISLFVGCSDGLCALVVPGASGSAQYADDRPGQTRANQTAAFFGDIRGNAYAVDASTGKLLWKTGLILIRSRASPRGSRFTTGVSTWPSPRSKNRSRRVSTTCAARSVAWLRCWMRQRENKSGRHTRFRRNRQEKNGQGREISGTVRCGHVGPDHDQS